MTNGTTEVHRLCPRYTGYGTQPYSFFREIVLVLFVCIGQMPFGCLGVSVRVRIETVIVSVSRQLVVSVREFICMLVYICQVSSCVFLFVCCLFWYFSLCVCLFDISVCVSPSGPIGIMVGLGQWVEPEPKARATDVEIGRALLRSKEQQVLLGNNTSLFRFYKLFGFFAISYSQMRYCCQNNKIVI